MSVQAPADSIVLEEEIDPNYVPTEDEIREYAKWLGMDLDRDNELFWVAKEGLKAPLPDNWKPCKTTDTEEIYYFNFASGESTWDHPCDEYYRNLYEEERKKKKAKPVNERKKKKKKESRSSRSSGGEADPKKAGGAPAQLNDLKPLPGIGQLNDLKPLGSTGGGGKNPPAALETKSSSRLHRRLNSALSDSEDFAAGAPAPAPAEDERADEPAPAPQPVAEKTAAPANNAGELEALRKRLATAEAETAKARADHDALRAKLREAADEHARALASAQDGNVKEVARHKEAARAHEEKASEARAANRAQAEQHADEITKLRIEHTTAMASRQEAAAAQSSHAKQGEFSTEYVMKLQAELDAAKRDRAGGGSPEATAQLQAEVEALRKRLATAEAETATSRAEHDGAKARLREEADDHARALASLQDGNVKEVARHKEAARAHEEKASEARATQRAQAEQHADEITKLRIEHTTAMASRREAAAVADAQSSSAQHASKPGGFSTESVVMKMQADLQAEVEALKRDQQQTAAPSHATAKLQAELDALKQRVAAAEAETMKARGEYERGGVSGRDESRLLEKLHALLIRVETKTGRGPEWPPHILKYSI